ncbi:hypothetical protein CC86DRAFT_187354 [Ophiobolus disseminans]|uniref:DUF7730 domain-containing protein n=1 Tax=Ophiobolus disseminans TaxID=1469910 RepID=A0A6A7A7J7_9PLEO|nr:hypothetical protein CC86DRAFT_187354 [Ophiobolus disseminans]
MEESDYSSYVEVVKQLYQASTFVCLHNTVLDDFCSTTFPTHLSLICSLHIHFQFRELDHAPVSYKKIFEFPAPWDERTFQHITEMMCHQLPNLRTLSVFLQGPLKSLSAYAKITYSLMKATQELESLDFMTVRLPQPAPDRTVAEAWLERTRANWQKFETQKRHLSHNTTACASRMHRARYGGSGYRG